MSTVTVQGKTTFAFNHAIRRVREYLKKMGLSHQMELLPTTYPQHPYQMEHIDIVPRCKILKAHLEDTFGTDRFSVKVTRRKTSPVIKITHDSMQQDKVVQIAVLYADSESLILEKFTNV